MLRVVGAWPSGGQPKQLIQRSAEYGNFCLKAVCLMAKTCSGGVIVKILYFQMYNNKYQNNIKEKMLSPWEPFQISKIFQNIF